MVALGVGGVERDALTAFVGLCLLHTDLILKSTSHLQRFEVNVSNFLTDERGGVGILFLATSRAEFSFNT